MKELSSPLTFFYKYVVIFVWFAGFGYGLREVLFTAPAYDARWFQYLAIWLGITIFMYFTTGTIKRVAIDGDTLIVSNFLTSDRIELSRIKTIDGSTFLSPKLVWFTLNGTSAFGSRITFLPKRRMQSGFGKHPIVQELTKELQL